MMKLKKIGIGLLAIGESIQPKDLIMHDVVGLGNQYNPFVCYVINHVGTVSVEEFHSRVLVYEHRISQ